MTGHRCGPLEAEQREHGGCNVGQGALSGQRSVAPGED
jgi:hypothetical protein